LDPLNNLTALRIGAGPPASERLCAASFPDRPATLDHAAVAQAVREALAAPLGFPPLGQSLTSEDHVAVALGAATPAAAAIVAGVVAELERCGVLRERIAVVVSDPRDADAVRAELAPRDPERGLEPGVAQVLVESHDPTDETQLCFAGLMTSERPLLLNRRLFDADVVLPISTELPTDGPDAGVYGGVFPDFCDRGTIKRLRRVRSVAKAQAATPTRKPGGTTARQRDANEAGWLIGAPLVLRVVPGPGGEVASVLAGEPTEVARQARAVGERVWSTPLPEPAELVVAVIGGGPEEQTWSSVGRAVEAAEAVSAPGAALAVWSDLDESIGPALGKLLAADDRERVTADLESDFGAEALAAWRLVRALERGPVYLRSRLRDEVVEDLGLTPLHGPDELLRLASHYPTRIVLDESQHVRFAPRSARDDE
jgi:nickel-dependent lactate racemase